MTGTVPIGYWEICDSRQGGVIVDINEQALCVRSPLDMHIGAELPISIFLSAGDAFARFQVLTRAIRKDLGCEEGWPVYEYELELIYMAEQDRLKLRNLLNIRQADNFYS
jgi:hypothetical protein